MSCFVLHHRDGTRVSGKRPERRYPLQYPALSTIQSSDGTGITAPGPSRTSKCRFRTNQAGMRNTSEIRCTHCLRVSIRRAVHGMNGHTRHTDMTVLGEPPTSRAVQPVSACRRFAGSICSRRGYPERVHGVTDGSADLKEKREIPRPSTGGDSVRDENRQYHPDKSCGSRILHTDRHPPA